MNKAGLVAAVAEKTGMSRKDSDKAVNAALDSVIEALAAGEKVQLVGFGYFEVKERRARMGINPQTKEPMEIPASRAATFTAGKAMKEAVAK